MKRLFGFYGGTFDPIHNGHVAIAAHASAVLRTPIDLIPAADPPHRMAPGASARHRAAMVELAVASHPFLHIDTRELKRQGRSFSVDTLRELRRQHGDDASFAWLIGADSLSELHTWKEWRELFALTHFVLADRVGVTACSDIAHSELSEALSTRWTCDPQRLNTASAGFVLRLEQPLTTVSATDIRSRIALRFTWRPLVPTAVADYIEQHRLYGALSFSPSS